MSTIVETGFTLRNERAADEPFLMELYASANEDLLPPAGCPEDLRQQIVTVEYLLQRQTIDAVFPTAVSQIVVIEGEPAGELVVDRTAASVRLIEISLLPRFRGRGVGTEVVKALCREAAERGIPLRLRVVTANKGARRLYRRLGFQDAAVDGEFLEMEWTKS